MIIHERTINVEGRGKIAVVRTDEKLRKGHVVFLDDEFHIITEIESRRGLSEPKVRDLGLVIRPLNKEIPLARAVWDLTKPFLTREELWDAEEEMFT